MSFSPACCLGGAPLSLRRLHSKSQIGVMNMISGTQGTVKGQWLWPQRQIVTRKLSQRAFQKNGRGSSLAGTMYLVEIFQPRDLYFLKKKKRCSFLLSGVLIKQCSALDKSWVFFSLFRNTRDPNSPIGCGEKVYKACDIWIGCPEQDLGNVCRHFYPTNDVFLSFLPKKKLFNMRFATALITYSSFVIVSALPTVRLHSARIFRPTFWYQLVQPHTQEMAKVWQIPLCYAN